MSRLNASYRTARMALTGHDLTVGHWTNGENTSTSPPRAPTGVTRAKPVRVVLYVPASKRPVAASERLIYKVAQNAAATSFIVPVHGQVEGAEQ